MVLKEVTSRSSGLYKCEVIGEHPTFRKESKQGNLTVFSKCVEEEGRVGRVEGGSEGRE